METGVGFPDSPVSEENPGKRPGPPATPAAGGTRRWRVLETRDAGAGWEPGVPLRHPRGQWRTVRGVKVNAVSIQE